MAAFWSFFHEKSRAKILRNWFKLILAGISQKICSTQREPFQKDPKATTSKGSCYPGDWSSLRAVPDRFVWTSVQFTSSSVGEKVRSAFREVDRFLSAPGASPPPLRGTDPPPERLRFLLPHSGPAKLDSGASQIDPEPLRSAKSPGSL